VQEEFSSKIKILQLKVSRQGYHDADHLQLRLIELRTFCEERRECTTRNAKAGEWGRERERKTDRNGMIFKAQLSPQVLIGVGRENEMVNFNSAISGLFNFFYGNAKSTRWNERYKFLARGGVIVFLFHLFPTLFIFCNGPSFIDSSCVPPLCSCDSQHRYLGCYPRLCQ
jgi:hypothetical protein